MHPNIRSSHSKLLFQKGVLKNFTKIHRKTAYEGLALMTFWNLEKLSNFNVQVLQFVSLIFIYLSMEKDHVLAKKVVKNLGK